MSRPSDRHACNRLSAPSTSSALPSTWIVAMVQSSSLARCQRAWLMESRCYPTQTACEASSGTRSAALRAADRSVLLCADDGRTLDLVEVARADWRDACLELRPEVFDRAAQGFHGARCVGAEGFTRAEEVDQSQQGFDITRLAVAFLDGAQNLHAPGQTVAAWGAETTGFLGEELFHVAQQADHVDLVVHSHGQTGTHTGADLGDATGIHLCVQVLRQQEAGTGAAWLPALELEAVAHAACVVFEQLASGQAKWQLPQARVLDLAGEAHQLGAVVFTAFAGQRLVPVVTVVDDGRYVAQGLDVVHARRLAPHADSGGEGRLGAWVGATAFQGVDQCDFFTADVTPGAGVHEQLEVKAGAQNVLAQQTRSLGFGHGTVQMFRCGGVFATQEDVATIGFECASTDQHAFHQQVRQLFHQHPVFPGVGLHLIGVTQQVTDVHGFVFGHQAPLNASGEACTAAALETGVLDRLDDVVRRLLGKGLAHSCVAV